MEHDDVLFAYTPLVPPMPPTNAYVYKRGLKLGVSCTAATAVMDVKIGVNIGAAAPCGLLLVFSGPWFVC